MKIYTKTGDHGETGLFGGPRVRKDAARIEAYGTIDELNAQLGQVRTLPLDGDLESALAILQNRLFDLGAELATPDAATRAMRRIEPPDVAWQESLIDRLEEPLPPLTTFILPGGTPAGAGLHLARCTCRRAERRIVTLAASEPVSPEVITFVNRLSDLLFVMARYQNHVAQCGDVPWDKSI